MARTSASGGWPGMELDIEGDESGRLGKLQGDKVNG